MPDARWLAALGLVAGAIALSAAFAWLTWTCGMSSVSETCTSTADCAAKSSCVSALHPMALPFLAAGVVGVGLAWARQSFALMALGIFAAAVGTIFGFSMGWAGIVPGVLLAVAGALLARDGVIGGAAVVASLAPLALIVGILLFAGGAFVLVYLAAAVPLLLWLGLAAWRAQRRPLKAA